jgi:putative flippase GtrA
VTIPDASPGADSPTDATRRPPAGMQGSLGPLFRIVRDQRVAFLIVGGINTLVGTGWFIFFQLTIGGSTHYMVSLLCAHVAAVLCAFVLYRRFVFRVRGHVWLDLARFEVVNLTSLGVNAVALPFVVELIGLAAIPAQLLITSVTMLISYFGHRGFSFRRSPDRSEQDDTTRTELA